MERVPESVVLVEGRSDQAAVEVLFGHDALDSERLDVAVVSMGGATNLVTHLERFAGKAERIAVLCDAGEEAYVRRMIEADGVSAGVFVCRSDLEDELVRAVGLEFMLDFIDRQGEGRRFRTMQKQPDQRDQPVSHHVHNFFGIFSGRKLRYARDLASELNPSDVPEPLQRLVHWMQS